MRSTLPQATDGPSWTIAGARRNRRRASVGPSTSEVRTMRIAVFGTGTVGRTLAGRLSELGHSVVIGTRDPASTLARTDPDAMGNPPFSAWQAEHPDVGLATFADAAADAEIAFVATSGAGALDALGLAGAGNLAGKVVVDVSNALDFSGGFPPALFVQDT